MFVDLDGTLTRTELLPAIARRTGLDEEMQKLTDATLAGEIPFDVSFRRRVSMLSQVPVKLVQDQILEVPVFEGLLGLLCEHRDRVFVVTGNLDVWVRPFLERHGLRGLCSIANVRDGKVVGIRQIINKSVAMTATRPQFSIAIGDGANDAAMVRHADVGIAWCGLHRAARPLLEVADYAFAREESLCRFLRQWW